MLEYIFLRNFQKFKKIKVEFDPFVTTIVGDTDQGKSTILRALRCICLNKAPSDPIRHGQESFLIKLKVDGKIVKRSKGDGNAYGLDDSVYRAFGSKVPDDIALLLNIDDNNFQRQLDLPFWFTDTPGQVSRNLNDIVNLGVIDQTLANALREAKDAKAVVDVTRSRLQEAKTKRASLKWVPVMQKEWGQVEVAEQRAQRCAEDGAKFIKLVREAGKHRTTAKVFDSATLGGNAAVLAGERAMGFAKRARTLASLVRQAREAEALSKVELPDFEPLLQYREHADKIAENRRTLETLVEEAQLLEEERCLSETKLKKLSKQLKKFKGRCPLCGQKTRSVLSHLETCTSPKTRQVFVVSKKTGSESRRDT